MNKQRKVRVFRESGFTLVELLLVVAIIAVLVAVSIPMISNSLEKSRHSTDAANEKAAIAEIKAQYMAGEDAVINGTNLKLNVLDRSDPSNNGNGNWNHIYFYDAASGGLKTMDMRNSIKPYGKHKDHEGKILLLMIENTGDVRIKWITPTTNNMEVPFGGVLSSHYSSNDPDFCYKTTVEHQFNY